MIGIFSLRDNYTLFMHAIKRIHLVKMRLPFDGVYTYLRISSFGDNLELAFFGAVTPVAALFVYKKGLTKHENGTRNERFCRTI